VQLCYPHFALADHVFVPPLILRFCKNMELSSKAHDFKLYSCELTCQTWKMDVIVEITQQGPTHANEQYTWASQ